MASAAEEANLLQMQCYMPEAGWQEASNVQIQDGGYLTTNASCCSPGSRETSCPKVQNGASDRLLLCPDGALWQRDKRRFSKTSGTSSRTRAGDLSV